jgi:hypothetical protein
MDNLFHRKLHWGHSQELLYSWSGKLLLGVRLNMVGSGWTIISLLMKWKITFRTIIDDSDSWITWLKEIIYRKMYLSLVGAQFLLIIVLQLRRHVRGFPREKYEFGSKCKLGNKRESTLYRTQYIFHQIALWNSFTGNNVIDHGRRIVSAHRTWELSNALFL